MTSRIVFCERCRHALGHCICGPKTVSVLSEPMRCERCGIPDDLCTCHWLETEVTTENPKEAAGRKKCPLHLNPPAASEHQAWAHLDGAGKYGEWNWREAGINLTTYVGAAKRHLDGLMRGEWLDPASGLPHWAHIMACGAISLDAWENGVLNDDRPGGQKNDLPVPSGGPNGT